jgi:hypothetical protein
MSLTPAVFVPSVVAAAEDLVRRFAVAPDDAQREEAVAQLLRIERAAAPTAVGAWFD